MDSLWIAAASTPPEFPPLSGDIEADVVVIGGGITGVNTAWQLHEAGKRVVLLEAGRIGARNTGRSTGNLYVTVSSGLGTLREKWDVDALREATSLRAAAIDRIEAAVARFGLSCGFERRRLHACVAGEDPAQGEKLEKDHDACAEAGLSPRWLESVPQLPFPVRRAFALDRQAQFNPYLYAIGLARALSAQGVELHEHSQALDVDASEGLVRTALGSVRGRDIVMATHTPIGFNLVQAEMIACREYGISARVDDGVAPEGIFWIRDQARSVRNYRHEGREHLVVVGEKHKTGEGDASVDYPQRLRDYAREKFGASQFAHAWSAQQFRPADGLPYIGRSAHHNILIATGFGADGLTWGTVAASLLTDLVLEREPRGGELFSPRRLTPGKSARTWAEENAAVMRHLIGDRTSDAPDAELATIAPGEGRILEVDGEKRAVYRAADSSLCVLSPVCTHLKCHVAWNPEARTWDCPCHGSRFHPDGRVLEGPAMSSLERLRLRGH